MENAKSESSGSESSGSIEKNGEYMVTVRKKKKFNKEAAAGILFASPWIIGLLVFTIYPIIASLVFSFSNHNSFVITRWGFFNFTTVFADVFFSDGFRNTLWMVAFNVPISTVLGVLIGRILCSETFGLKIYRTIFYLPAVASIVAVAFMWQWIFNTAGPLNSILDIFGIPSVGWLTDERAVKPALLIMNAWGVGGTIILYLAAFSNVPVDLYEAADIDGAGTVRKFFKITLPQISPVISFNVLMGIIGGFQYFLPALLMTHGGPGRSSYFIGQVIYENAFRQGLMGYASAISWILFVVIFCISLIYLKLSKKITYYAGE